MRTLLREALRKLGRLVYWLFGGWFAQLLVLPLAGLRALGVQAYGGWAGFVVTVAAVRWLAWWMCE